MPNPIKHKRLIQTGCWMWIISIILDAYSLQPFSSIGMILAPFITIAGVLVWAKYYKLKNGRYPNLKNVKKNMENVNGEWTLNFEYSMKHMFALWVVVILFYMFLTFSFYFGILYSKRFDLIRQHCNENPEISELIGEINYFGLQIGLKTYDKSESVEFVYKFTIIGEKGVFDVKANLIKKSNSLIIDKIEIKRITLFD